MSSNFFFYANKSEPFNLIILNYLKLSQKKSVEAI